MSKSMLGLGAAIFLWAILTVNAIAQNCDDTNVVLPDFSRFDINNDGTVTDIESGLTWQRCVVGQQWNGRTCAGKPVLYNWQQAASVYMDKRAGPSSPNWRLPKVSELAAIIDLRCDSPRIDLTLFPETQARPHWTLNNVPQQWGQAYTLSFGHEGVARAHKSEKHYVRLVSGRD